MKSKLFLLLFTVLGILSPAAFAQNIGYVNYCMTGNTPAKVSGLNSTNTLQASYPRCTVTVYLTGTTTLATLTTAPGGGALSNPFTAMVSGLFNFYAPAGAYDITLSGGDNGGFPAPVTLPGVTLGGSGGGGGGGGSPASPANSIQLANPALNGFISDPNFLITPSTHLFTTGGKNMTIDALNSIPRRVFDPMDTNRSGGLAAALAGTSGFTPTQVIQATLDYAECQTYPDSWSKVLLPSGITIPIGQLLIWTHQELSGESESVHAFLQHNDNTKPMIVLHGHTDTLTCPGRGTLNPPPGAPGNVVIKNLGISGMNVSSSKDIGIQLSAPSDGYACVGCRVSHISGGTPFGGQGVLLVGTSNFADHIGYDDSQIAGCLVYTNGLEPVSNSPTGQCGAVEDDVLDGELDNVYSSDGAQFIGGPTVLGPGACYPGCAGFVFGGLNGYANGVFSQVSDIGAILGGTNVRFTNYRIDATSMEGVRLIGGSNILTSFHITAPCTSKSLLQSNYNSGIPTGCFGFNTGTGSGINADNRMTGVRVSTNGGILGQSFAQASFRDGAAFNTAPNYYDFLGVAGPNNTGPNDWMLYTNVGIAPSTPPVIAYNPNATGVLTATTGTANISGLSMLTLGNATPLSHVIGGIPGQIVTIYASSGVTGTINNTPNSGSSPFGILTCTGLPITVSVIQGAIFQYSLNHLAEIGCDTQTNHAWINWAGNPAVTAPSFIDFYGEIQGRAYGAQAAPDYTNLHGSTSGSQACFALESVFPDGSHVVSPQSCTNVNIGAQTPGGIFASFLPQASAFNLYLISNAQGNGVPLGKIGPSVFAGGSTVLWDGPGTIGLGGNGVQPVGGPGDNNTGEFWAPFGVLLSTGGTQPTCGVQYRGLTWLVRGATGVADTFQVCQKNASDAYAWFTPAGGGGGGGTVTGSGTINAIALWTTTSAIGSSHLSESGGLDIFTQPVQINDGSGFGGGSKLTEAAKPTGAFAPASGTDVFWASVADHWPLFNPNNAANDFFFVGASKANTYTAGDCLQIGATLHDIVDSGAPCGTGGGGSLGYFIATTAAPAAASQTTLSQVAGVGRIQNYSANNTAVGSFSIVLTTADGTTIQAFPIQCTSTGCTLNTPTFFTASIRANSTVTTVSCSTSGTATFAQPFAGTAYRMGTVHLSACVGTASYTYPNGFSFTPFVSGSTAAVAAVSSATTTVININAGSSTTGFIKFEEQQ